MLEEMEAFLHSLLTRVRFYGEGLLDILRSDCREFPRKVSRLMDKGVDLREAWHLAAECFCNMQDRPFVASIIDELGKSGPEEEIIRLDRNLQLCREHIEAARENMRTKGRSEAVLPVYISLITALVLM